MASALRPLIIRHMVLPRLKTTPWVQCRKARVLDVRFVQTPTAPDLLERYREKLEAKVKSEGLGSLEELRKSRKHEKSRVRNESSPPSSSEPLDALLHDSPPFVQREASQPPFVTVKRPEPANAPPPGVKTLSSFVDVDKLSVHPDPKEVEFIWRARFLDDKDSLCAVIPRETYRRLETSARQHPMFVLPLPRPSGAEIHLLQWAFPAPLMSTVIFTSLAEYKLRGEFAVPHTTLSHHLELAEEKGLVLAQGTVTPERGVSADEARWLVVALQKFYGAVQSEASGARRRRLLDMFSGGEEEFRVEELIKEAEKLV